MEDKDNLIAYYYKVANYKNAIHNRYDWQVNGYTVCSRQTGQIKVNGKTGFRIAASMPEATKFFNRQVENENLRSNDYLWFPNITNRNYALRKFSLQFNKELEYSGLKHTNDGQTRSSYSLRHFALTFRLNSSAGKVNVFLLAKNAGTSVQMLEQYYIKYLKPSKNVVANLQHIEF
mgnify:CR=1 FL=1